MRDANFFIVLATERPPGGPSRPPGGASDVPGSYVMSSPARPPSRPPRFPPRRRHDRLPPAAALVPSAAAWRAPGPFSVLRGSFAGELPGRRTPTVPNRRWPSTSCGSSNTGSVRSTTGGTTYESQGMFQCFSKIGIAVDGGSSLLLQRLRFPDIRRELGFHLVPVEAFNVLPRQRDLFV